eukprot:scaffold269_cov229-Pinguiococcus_pyrenoidosus.AAC.5
MGMVGTDKRPMSLLAHRYHRQPENRRAGIQRVVYPIHGRRKPRNDEHERVEAEPMDQLDQLEGGLPGLGHLPERVDVSRHVDVDAHIQEDADPDRHVEKRKAPERPHVEPRERILLPSTTRSDGFVNVLELQALLPSLPSSHLIPRSSLDPAPGPGGAVRTGDQRQKGRQEGNAPAQEVQPQHRGRCVAHRGVVHRERDATGPEHRGQLEKLLKERLYGAAQRGVLGTSEEIRHHTAHIRQRQHHDHSEAEGAQLRSHGRGTR